ncbi:MAG TPA: hypothetical protein VME42_10465 [Steroidobacteraceae bacterium]|nr:hypothetical protein [Steroidobacteraceae bacterium]
MEIINSATSIRVPWNKGKLVGQKAPFKLKEIREIRGRLQIASRCREPALFNLAPDSKLRACDLVQLRVRDVCHGQNMASRALILQQKTQRPVRFEITEPTRDAVSAWIEKSALNSGVEFRGFLVPEPNSEVTTPVYRPTRPNRRFMGSTIGVGHNELRHAYATANESDTHI